jgi:hypothetical protein
MLRETFYKTNLLCISCLLLLDLTCGSVLSNIETGSAKTPHRVPKVHSEIRVDGVLDEAVWQQALVIPLEYETRPGENIEAPVKTDVLLAYDNTNLYIAFRAFDPDPKAIRASISDHDQLGGDDWVGVVLDTFNDERRHYEFISTAGGVLYDAIATTDVDGTAWDAIWDGTGKINSEGYIVEMAIPFSSLNFQRTDGEQIWGFDGVRSYPRDVDHRMGTFPRDRSNNCLLCQAEKIIGFEGATPGKNIEIDPTISGFVTQERENYTSGPFVESEKQFNPGITGRWGFTSNLTLSATINPDFSQVEADAAQLDINTQFALSYTEKRPFFLEGLDFFQTRLTAVYTRTVADPDWGIKITGKENGNGIGVFVAQDAITNLLISGTEHCNRESSTDKNISSVVRWNRDVGKSNSLGILMTDRESEGYHNRLAGCDGELRFSPKDRIRFQLLGSATQYPTNIATNYNQPNDEFQGMAGDIIYNHDTRTWDWYGMYRQVQPEFRADLGFMPQVDYRYSEIGWGHTWTHDPGHWWNSLNVGSGAEYETDVNDNLHRKRFTYWFNYAGPMQGYFDTNGGIGKRTYNGVEFNDRLVWIDFNFRPSGSLYCFFGSEFGDVVDFENTRQGRHFTLQPEIEYRFGRHLTMTLDHNFDRLFVDAGRLYTANISQIKLVYQFNKRTFVRTISQYVDYRRNTSLYLMAVTPQEQHIFNQFLFSYKINPQTVLYLGYSDNYLADQDINPTQTNRTIFAKIGYAWVI